MARPPNLVKRMTLRPLFLLVGLALAGCSQANPAVAPITSSTPSNLRPAEANAAARAWLATLAQDACPDGKVRGNLNVVATFDLNGDGQEDQLVSTEGLVCVAANGQEIHDAFGVQGQVDYGITASDPTHAWTTGFLAGQVEVGQWQGQPAVFQDVMGAPYDRVAWGWKDGYTVDAVAYLKRDKKAPDGWRVVTVDGKRATPAQPWTGTKPPLKPGYYAMNQRCDQAIKEAVGDLDLDPALVTWTPGMMMWAVGGGTTLTRYTDQGQGRWKVEGLIQGNGGDEHTPPPVEKIDMNMKVTKEGFELDGERYVYCSTGSIPAAVRTTWFEVD